MNIRGGKGGGKGNFDWSLRIYILNYITGKINPDESNQLNESVNKFAFVGNEEQPISFNSHGAINQPENYDHYPMEDIHIVVEEIYFS